MKYLPLLLAAITGFSAGAGTVSELSVMYGASATPAEKNAAMELASHLGASLGKKLSNTPEKTASGTTVIYVGSTDFAKANGIDPAALKAEEFLIKTVDQHVIIIGGQPHGTLYGVLEFLERFAGVDWLDEWTRHIPRHNSISWPDHLNLAGKPAFARRGIYVNRCTDLETRIQFRARCRDNMFWEEAMPSHVVKRWGIAPAFGSPNPVHSLYYYTRQWPKELDDCFSLSQDGLRIRAASGGGPGQICFSNPRARTKIAEQLKAFIVADRQKNPVNYPLVYNLSLNDTHDRCHCDECRKRAEKYQAYSGVVLEYLNAVAAAIAPLYPDVKLQTLAYLFTEKPPVGIKPANNVSIVIALSPWSSTPLKTMFPVRHPANRAGRENLMRWHELCPSPEIWNYWITFDTSPSCNAGMVNTITIAENLKEFHQLGAYTVFSECERPDTTTFHPLRVFLGYKLKWNPDQPLEPLLKRFFTGYYQKGAPAMREFYDYLLKRQQECDNLNVPDAAGRKYLDTEFFRRAEEYLNRAERAVGRNDAVQLNLIRERVPLDIARLVCRNVPDAPGLPSRETVIARLKQNWPRVIKRYYTGAVWQKGPLNTMDKFLRQMSAPPLKPGLKYPLTDPRFQKKEVFDITWQDFNAIDELKHFGLHLADDPEAVGGKAMCLSVPKRGDTEKVFHSTTYRCGIWRDGKQVTDRYYPKPSDEKYHLLEVGQVELSPSTLLWLHNSWMLQQHLDPVYRPGQNNRYDIFVSVKRQGPAYVKNSAKPNAIYIDRILLVAPDIRSE